MKTQKTIYLVLSSIFTAIGGLFIFLGLWMFFWTRYYTEKYRPNAPNLVDDLFDHRLFLWPLLIGGVFMAFACGGFLSLILSRRRHQHDHDAA
jgi:hypothetical protein